MNVEIIPMNDIVEMEDLLTTRKSDIIGIDTMSITYIQPADTCSSSDEVQSITITAKNGVSCGLLEAEKEEVYYFDVTIPNGQHWSVNSGDELKALIDDFKKRLYQTNKFTENEK